MVARFLPSSTRRRSSFAQYLSDVKRKHSEYFVSLFLPVSYRKPDQNCSTVMGSHLEFNKIHSVINVSDKSNIENLTSK